MSPKIDPTECEKSSENPAKSRLFKRTGFVFTIINIVTLMQYINMQFLSGSMRGLEKDLGYSPGRMSFLIVCEQASMLTFIPVWGILSDLYEIKYVLISSSFFSGLVLIFLGLVKHYPLMLLLHAIRGIMMGCIVPATQKYVSLSNIKKAGRSLGVIHAFANLGRLISAVFVTILSPNEYFGLFGWRICSFGMGGSILITTISLFLIPRFKKKGHRSSLYGILKIDKDLTFSQTSSIIWKRFITIITRKTPLLLTLGHFLGNGVYTSAALMTMYLQYCRFSNAKAGITLGIVIISSALSALLGGFVSDRIHERFPKYGRVSMGIVYSIVKLIGFCICFFAFTFDNILDGYYLFVTVLAIVGATFSSVTVVDRAVLIDVLMPYEQSFGISIILLICGATSSIIFSPLLGFLLKTFGYQESTMDISEMPLPFVRENAFAIRNGVASLVVFSTTSSIFTYTFLLKTYDDDARYIREKILEMSNTDKSKDESKNTLENCETIDKNKI